jgi:hypothetical protein
MADPIYGEELLAGCARFREAWFAVAQAGRVVRREMKKREKPREKIRQDCQLDADRLKGAVPSGGDQRRMGGVYRVEK